MSVPRTPLCLPNDEEFFKSLGATSGSIGLEKPNQASSSDAQASGQAGIANHRLKEGCADALGRP